MDSPKARFRAGLRIGASLAAASFLLAVTFGATVRDRGGAWSRRRWRRPR